MPIDHADRPAVWQPADHPDDVARLTVLADSAAQTFLDRVLTHAALFEHAGAEVLALSDVLAATSCAHLTADADRRDAADAEAAFLVGLALGRRLSGPRPALGPTICTPDDAPHGDAIWGNVTGTSCLVARVTTV